MVLLRDIANMIRGTNNGATMRSFDIMFDKSQTFSGCGPLER